MDLLPFINKFFALGTVVAQLFLLDTVLYVLFFRKRYPRVAEWYAKYGLLIAFLIALVSMITSLYYSLVVGFPPCDLCWYQRIFMYPLVVLLGIAFWKKDSGIVTYALPLAFIGALIAAYHNFIDRGGVNVVCGENSLCLRRYVFEFGFITIPLMSLTAFALIIVFLLFVKYSKKT